MQLSSLPCCCHSPSVSWTCLGSASLFSLGCPSWLLRMTSVTTHSPEAPPHSEGVGQSCTVTPPHCQGGQRVGVCQSHDPKLLWCSSNKTVLSLKVSVQEHIDRLTLPQPLLYCHHAPLVMRLVQRSRSGM